MSELDFEDVRILHAAVGVAVKCRESFETEWLEDGWEDEVPSNEELAKVYERLENLGDSLGG